MSLRFRNRVDIGTLQYLHQYQLLLVILYSKPLNVSKTLSKTTVCLCEIIFLFKYRTYFAKKNTKSQLITKGRITLCFYPGEDAHFAFTHKKVNNSDSLQPSG